LNELSELSQRVKINKLLKQHIKEYGREEAFVRAFGEKAEMEKIEELQLYMVMLQKVFSEQQFTQKAYQIIENMGIPIYHRGVVEIIQAIRILHENPKLEKEKDAHILFETITQSTKIDLKTVEARIQTIIDKVVENEANKEYLQNVFGKQCNKSILPFIKGIKNSVEKEIIQEEIEEEIIEEDIVEEELSEEDIAKKEILAIQEKIRERIFEYPKEDIMDKAEDFFENVLKISKNDFNESYEAVKVAIVFMQVNSIVVNELSQKEDKLLGEGNIITKVEDIYPFVEKMFNLPENKSEELIKDGVKQILDLIEGTSIYKDVFQNVKMPKKQLVNENLLIEQFLLTLLWEIYLDDEPRKVSQILKKMGMSVSSDEYLYFIRCIILVLSFINKVGIKTAENLSKSKINEIANKLMTSTALQYQDTEEGVEQALRKGISTVLKNKITKHEYKKYVGSDEKVSPIIFIFAIAKKVFQMQNTTLKNAENNNKIPKVRY